MLNKYKNPEVAKTAMQASIVTHVILISIAVIFIGTGNAIPWWLVVAIILA